MVGGSPPPSLRGWGRGGTTPPLTFFLPPPPGGDGGADSGAGAGPRPDRLPGHLRRGGAGVFWRPGERRADSRGDLGAGEHGLRFPPAPLPRGALPAYLCGVWGALLPRDHLWSEAVCGEEAEQCPGACDRLNSTCPLLLLL